MQHQRQNLFHDDGDHRDRDHEDTSYETAYGLP